jgi:hypothetical protein
LTSKGLVTKVVSKKDVGLFATKGSGYIVRLSLESDDVEYINGEEDENDSSKLVCVDGVDNDEVGEPGLKNCGIRFISRQVRSIELSWTNTGRRSLRSAKAAEVGSINTIAEADAAQASGPIVAGQELSAGLKFPIADANTGCVRMPKGVGRLGETQLWRSGNYACCEKLAATSR